MPQKLIIMGNESSIASQLEGKEIPEDCFFFHFKNLTNTCYCNAVLQGIVNSSYIFEYLENISKTVINNKLKLPKNVPFTELYNYFRAVFDGDWELYIKPSSLFKAMKKETENFPVGIQQDSHEFFVYLLDSFDKTITTFNEENDTNFKRPSTLFEGKRTYKYQCDTCNFTQTRDDAFVSFYIGLQNITESICIQNRINQVFEPELLAGDDKWMCDQCKEPREASLQISFSKLPPIFVIQLQRFAYDRKAQRVQKILKYIEIPFHIALRKDKGHKKHKYFLKTVIMHIGKGLEKGHYFALIKYHKIWVMANDNILSLLTKREVKYYLGPCSDNRNCYVPYLLFYEKKYREETMEACE